MCQILSIIYIPQLSSALHFVNYCTGWSHKPYPVAQTEDSTHLCLSCTQGCGGLGIEPTTFLLRGDSASHYTTIPPCMCFFQVKIFVCIEMLVWKDKCFRRMNGRVPSIAIKWQRRSLWGAPPLLCLCRPLLVINRPRVSLTDVAWRCK